MIPLGSCTMKLNSTTEMMVCSFKPRCWEPPGHYLCTPEPGRPGCVISIEKGVKPVNATSAEKRLGRKRSFPLYISHRRGLTKLAGGDFFEPASKDWSQSVKPFEPYETTNLECNNVAFLNGFFFV